MSVAPLSCLHLQANQEITSHRDIMIAASEAHVTVVHRTKGLDGRIHELEAQLNEVRERDAMAGDGVVAEVQVVLAW